MACRRYSSEGRQPARHLAIYEAADLAGLDESLDMMRAPYRLAENMAWKQWDTGEQPAITWEDAATFKPIYRNPWSSLARDVVEAAHHQAGGELGGGGGIDRVARHHDIEISKAMPDIAAAR